KFATHNRGGSVGHLDHAARGKKAEICNARGSAGITVVLASYGGKRKRVGGYRGNYVAVGPLRQGSVIGENGVILGRVSGRHRYIVEIDRVGDGESVVFNRLDCD